MRSITRLALPRLASPPKTLLQVHPLISAHTRLYTHFSHRHSSKSFTHINICCTKIIIIYWSVFVLVLFVGAEVVVIVLFVVVNVAVVVVSVSCH